VNDERDPLGGHPDGAVIPVRRSPALVILAILLFIEFLLIAAGAVYLLIELLIDIPQSYASAIAIFVLALLAAVWVGMIALHTLRGRPWTRGATVVWQVLQASVGIGCLQGLFARPDLGWPLIVLSVVVLVLLFTKSVVAATARGDE
jgi:hypothetical protein